MLDREPFLRAIFAEPAQDLPRLVFADYLEEQGQEDWANVIRLGVQHAQHPKDDVVSRGVALAAVFAAFPNPTYFGWYDRGFQAETTITISVDELLDEIELRQRSVTTHPHWFGCTSLKVNAGQILTTEPLRTILTLPAFENVVSLDLSGRVIELPVHLPEPTSEGDGLAMTLYDLETRPIITVRMVEELADMRECRRLVSLDLRNNELDNDAVRALADSRNFIRLTHLALSEGNRFKGRTWQRVIERFGQDVVL